MGRVHRRNLFLLFLFDDILPRIPRPCQRPHLHSHFHPHRRPRSLTHYIAPHRRVIPPRHHSPTHAYLLISPFRLSPPGPTPPLLLYNHRIPLRSHYTRSILPYRLLAWHWSMTSVSVFTMSPPPCPPPRLRCPDKLYPLHLSLSRPGTQREILPSPIILRNRGVGRGRLKVQRETGCIWVWRCP